MKPGADLPQAMPGRWRRRAAQVGWVLAVVLSVVVVWVTYIALRERPQGTPTQQEASRVANRDREVLALPADARPVLILLHGAGLNGRMWDAVTRHLDGRMRVVALDLPGHGVRRDEVFTLEGAKALVARVVQQVAPAAVVLAGDSLGGYVAMASASAIPQEQLRGLVLAGCSANFDGSRVWRAWRQRTVARVVMAVTSEDRMATLALERFGVAPQDQRNLKATGMRLWAVEEAQEELRPVDFKGLLARVEQPVLVINGDGDTNAVAHEAEFLAVARQSRQYRFAQTGHGVSLLRPTEFAKQLNAFGHQVLPP